MTKRYTFQNPVQSNPALKFKFELDTEQHHHNHEITSCSEPNSSSPEALAVRNTNPTTPQIFLEWTITSSKYLHIPTILEHTNKSRKLAATNTAREEKITERPTSCTNGRLIKRDNSVSASQLKIGEEAIKVRMGKGKGSFDHWASRIAVSKIIFELKGDLHEKVVRDAFRLAGNKMPGQYEFVKRGDPAVVGITKLDGVTMEELKRPRREIPLDILPIGSTAETMPSTASASMSPEA
ncbi:hypothetical protein D0Z07_0202 [Hyphodiscus hymeniophilus]|uniref:Ribosomal protein L16 n=1 Tax=Hyphodiscus hymeniophilus TaxID=353542 RepID=A0A9P7B0W5_9HELO|nr:hypothetical protein D0Z07_0202 [Hyphodiscus hymeniophilus]